MNFSLLILIQFFFFFWDKRRNLFKIKEIKLQRNEAATRVKEIYTLAKPHAWILKQTLNNTTRWTIPPSYKHRMAIRCSPIYQSQNSLLGKYECINWNIVGHQRRRQYVVLQLNLEKSKRITMKANSCLVGKV